MNTASTVNSINKLSFFKLPLIFIGIFFVIYYGAIQCFNFFVRDIPIEYLFNSITNTFLSLLLPLFLFFVTAVFCCQKYRLHSVASNGPIVGLIAIIFSALFFGWGQLYGLMFGFAIRQLSEVLYSTHMLLLINVFSYFMRIIGYVLFVAVLCFLFYLIGNKNATMRSAFPLDGAIGSRIYAVMYSFLMLFLSILCISFGSAGVFSLLLMEWGYYDTKEMILIFIPIVVIMLLIHYVIFYLATRNHFKRIDSTLRLGKLSITVLITYLFNFMVGLLTVFVIFLFSNSFIFMIYDMNYDSLIILFIILAILFCLINVILLFVFSRLSVKIMYS